MAVYTSTHTTDGDATPDAVTADITCRRITLRPNLGSITGGWLAYAPTTSVTPYPCDESESFTFDAGPGQLWQQGAVVGYTKTTNTGPFTFYKKHE